MAMLSFTIDDQSVSCAEGSTILQAADAAGIYIPRMCFHPDLPPVDEMKWAKTIHQGKTEVTGGQPGSETEAHCNLCLVDIDGRPEPVNSCITPVENGMTVRTDSGAVVDRRKQALAGLLADHPHACLTCAQKEGCSRTDCSSNVAIEERCCVLLGRCELEKVADFIGIPGDTQRYIPVRRPVITDDPLYIRDYNLCIGCLRCVRVCQLAHGRDILGATWKDGRAWVGTLNGAGLKDAQCRFCGACVEICPTGALRDKEDVPAVRRDAPVPCAANCPAGIDIPQYVQAIASGNYRKALDIIRSRVPFPGILGYVCFHPCESNCRRSRLDQPVAICDLKRFVADTMLDEALHKVDKLPDSGKKVAIVGSGPAGLTAAYYLACQGHHVDIFDRESKPGGMLRYGIPDYRLPQDILDRELNVLDSLGISFHMDHRFNGGDVAADLKSQGFDAVLIAAGVPVSKKLSIENADSDGIYAGLEFLKSAKTLHEPRLNGRVVVIGGGNVAIDAAMTALRLGAALVDMVCLESRDEMPAHEWEIAQAEEEGISIHTSLGPKRFTVDNGRVSGIDLKKCTRVFDSQGRFDPQYDEDDITHIDADTVIVTIGQQGDPKLMAEDAAIAKGPGHTLKVNEDFVLGREDIFAAGDVVRGPSSVVDSIADGRKVANIIDRFLGGIGLTDIDYTPSGFTGSEPGFTIENFGQSRQMPITEIPDARKSEFSLIQQTFSEQAAVTEAQRCLHCYLRRMITPVTLPPEKWLPLAAETVDAVPDAEGVFQLLDSDKKVIRISGTADMRQGLRECLDNPGNARWFIWEADPMYTKRESELIQQHLQKYGELPGGGGDDDLDDLF